MTLHTECTLNFGSHKTNKKVYTLAEYDNGYAWYSDETGGLLSLGGADNRGCIRDTVEELIEATRGMYGDRADVLRGVHVGDTIKRNAGGGRWESHTVSAIVAGVVWFTRGGCLNWRQIERFIDNGATISK